MEDGALKINAAVMAYAKDNNKYRIGYEKFMLGYSYLLERSKYQSKWQNLSASDTAGQEVKLDYYYKADNQRILVRENPACLGNRFNLNFPMCPGRLWQNGIQSKL